MTLPAMQETRVRSLGWEDTLVKEMAIHSSILAWKILWTEEPGGLHGVGKSWTQLSKKENKHQKKTEKECTKMLTVVATI